MSCTFWLLGFLILSFGTISHVFNSDLINQMSSVSDAIRAVVEYSENAVELLRRKKLKRDILFQYLTDCGIVAPVSAEKHELILRVLQFWGTALPAIKDLSVCMIHYIKKHVFWHVILILMAENGFA